ncbi:MAG: nucleotide sugar dehydrogenase [Myxococcales bacterium]|nr:nucleotide sugar dehydrogenase [Myxococcales bacterium]
MSLQEKIQERTARVGIIGMGYVGLPLARTFWAAGYHVIGVDIDPDKVSRLTQGQNYLKHFGADYIRDMAASERFSATADFSELKACDVVIMCVPTPLDKNLNPDLRFVEETTDNIGKYLSGGRLVILESTTYPGTTRDVVLPRLTAASGLRAGEDFYVAYSPEREDPGRANVTTQTIPKLVGGIDSTSGELARALYANAVDTVILTSSAEVAEAAKLFENVYRSVNIALANEMKVILSAMDIDVWEVINAAATKPFGFQAFYPGPGLGGHCIPIDPFYLAFKAKEYGHTTRFIELAGEINRAMPNYVVDRIIKALNEDKKALHGSKILILGLAYKPDVDDARESPSFELIEQMRALGADVDYHDPHIPKAPKTRARQFSDASVELTEHTLRSYDAVIIATHHSSYDWRWLGTHARLIIDTRGVMKQIARPRARVVDA